MPPASPSSPCAAIICKLSTASASRPSPDFQDLLSIQKDLNKYWPWPNFDYHMHEWDRGKFMRITKLEYFKFAIAMAKQFPKDLGLSALKTFKIDPQTGERMARAEDIVDQLSLTIRDALGIKAKPEIATHNVGGVNRIREVRMCAKNFHNPIPFDCPNNYVGCKKDDYIHLY